MRLVSSVGLVDACGGSVIEPWRRGVDSDVIVDVVLDLEEMAMSSERS